MIWGVTRWCVRSGSYQLFMIFFFKQKTAYEMRISDWSSDVCSSDLPLPESSSLMMRADEKSDIDAASAASSEGSCDSCDPVRSSRSASLPARPIRRLARSEERRVGKACVRTC